MTKPKINPLSRRPKSRRLVIAVRGAAGSGKSHFAASLADAGIGRLCLFDTERKARLMQGSDGSKFDAIEIEHPDELPEFIDWALDGEGREQNYTCYALDSWAMYFGRKHRQTVQAVRERTGDALASPTAEDLANDQIMFQEVLRRLCTDSGACVVITDQIGAKGKEDREENEMGRVLPMTSSGLEYFVDVMIELAVKVEGFEKIRVARVVKSNSNAFPVGMELKNPTFKDFLDQLNVTPAPEIVSEMLEAATEKVKTSGDSLSVKIDLDFLTATAEGYGLSRADLVIAARHYCKQPELELLIPDQIEMLLERMQERYGKAIEPLVSVAISTPESDKVKKK
jgi:hypothetical protein